MINWIKTHELFGFSSSADLLIKRPKVVCICDGCGKERIITIRVKSRIINNHISWYCPSCICLGISNKISQNMIGCWRDPNYRNNQIKIKHKPNYRLLQSKKIIDLWQSNEYRDKVGIRSSGFIEKCKQKYNNQFIYDNSSFQNWKTKIKITCTICNTTFYRKPLQHLTVGYCPTCNTSHGQREINNFIRSLGVTTILNDRSTLDGLEIDIKTDKLSIEYHGLYWHSYNKQETAEQRFRHQHKAIRCIKSGIKLFQFFDFEWQTKRHIIESMIQNAFGLSQTIYARQLQLQQLNNIECQEFFENNHLQGYKPASIILGLIDDNDIKIAISFSRIKNGFEIARLATKCGVQVVGGCSRLITHFKRLINEPLYTFADLRYSSGNVYSQVGFKKQNITKPGYFYYCKRGSKYYILSRQQCQKHKLHELLGDNFDPTTSESQNMFNNGFRRVWTAGNISYSK